MRRLLLIFISLFIGCYSFAQKTTIKIEMEKIQKNYGVHFVYNSNMDLNQSYTGVPLTEIPLKEALRLLFKNSKINYIQRGNNIILEQQTTVLTTKSKERKVDDIHIYTISGYVKDEKGEPLINATIWDKTSKLGTVTNEHGYFSLSLSQGNHSISVSYIGFNEETKAIILNKNCQFVFVLKDNATLEEVVVQGDLNSPLLTTQTGKSSLTYKDINTEFSLLSSPDVVKTLQRISGVSSGIELASGLYVHGGSGDENLFLFDGTPLYQINHSLGLFSSFNTELIRNIDFYKSGFPARYGGRLSSITDVRTKDGDIQNYHGSFSMGLLDGKINLEGPLIKGKTSFSFGIRRSWIDFFLKPAFAIANHGNKEGNKTSFNYLFHDLNAKVTHNFSDNSKLSISIYSGFDSYNINNNSIWLPYIEETKNKFKWGNLNTSLNWRFSSGNKLFCNITGFFTHNHSTQNYVEENQLKKSESITQKTSLDVQDNNSRIHNWGVKTDFDYRPNAYHKINFGGNYSFLNFKTQTIQQTLFLKNDVEQNDTTRIETSNCNRAHEFSFYIEDEMRLTRRCGLDVGLNYSFFKTINKLYQHLDPRFAVKYLFNDKFSAKLSYTYMTQYVHQIASTYLEMPTNYWVLTTSAIPPTTSRQLAMGLYAQATKDLRLSIEGFYKTTHHLLQYRNWMGVQPPASHWEKDVIEGEGRSYGLEMDMNYRKERHTIQASYTLSWALRKYVEFGIGWFRDKFDNRHKFNITWRYALNKHITLFASWIYHSGNRMTLPTRYITLPILPGESIGLTKQYFFDEPNNIGLPAYHRLDLGANFTQITKKGHERIWNISLYNAYCHFNTMFAKVYQDENGGFKIKCKGYIPIIPSVSYTLKF
ncbi:carboxypeptidase-like regulatory domain-containing protein [Hallella colorans]|uniref:Outer membrane receptor protein involved in Fe transport n=1 Tax=Hallella colorans TaxID=1703337 RepID=A0A2U0UP43_9BACT|nr:outer membrane receptor protein involved in Fe transport [Hallella colorans]